MSTAGGAHAAPNGRHLVLAVAGLLLVSAPAIAWRHPTAAQAEPAYAPGTLFLAAPSADAVSTVSGGAMGDPVGTGLSGPRGLAVDGLGSVYVADTGSGRVLRIDAGGSQTTLADGLDAPAGVAIDAFGHVVVAESGSGRVVTLGTDGADGPRDVAGGFLRPVAVAVGPSGDVLVADAGANEVIDVSPDGARTAVGSGLADPQDVAVAADGTVLIADTGHDRVVAVGPDGAQQEIGSGLLGPDAVAVGGGGQIYVADTGHARVVQIAPDGTQSAAADLGAVALAAYLPRQSIVLDAVPDSASVGQSYVAGATGGDSGRPVTFSAAAGSTGCTVDPSGVVSFTGSGTCIVGADQAGAPGYRPAHHVQQAIHVVRGSQTLEFASAAPTSAAVGETYVASATGGAAAGPIAFSAAAASTGCAVSPTGTVRFVHVGTCTVVADRDGDANWSSAAPVQQQVAVGAGTQTITFTSGAPAAAVVGDRYQPAAVSGASGLPVSLSVDASSTVCSLGSDGVISFVAAGTCTVRAEQAGSIDWAPAEPVQQDIRVTHRPGTPPFLSTPPRYPVVGQTYVVIATSTTGDPVSYAADADSTGCTVAPEGTVLLVAVGGCVVDATQSGGGSVAQQRFAVHRGPQHVEVVSRPPQDAAVGRVYTVAATGTSARPVRFTADPAGTGCTVGADGTVQFTHVGTCLVDADEGGDRNHAPAPQVQQAIAVGRGDQRIVLDSTPSTAAVVGATYVARARGGASGRPVEFSAYPPSRGVCSVAADGVVRFTAVGTCTVVAAQAGTVDYRSAPKARQGIRVRLAQDVRFTSVPAWAPTAGAQYPLTATGGGSGKRVRFSVPTASAAVCGIAGAATVVYRAAGTCTLLAAQDGTTTYAPGHAQQSFPVFGPSVDERSPIRHVILLFQENHSFDEVLGAYCTTRPTPCDGYVGPVKLRDGTVAPMTASPDIVPYVDHGLAGQQRAVDGGAMDGWGTVRGCEAPTYSCLTYYRPSGIPNLAALADRFTVSDRTFSMADSPSWAGHLYAAAATLDGFTGGNPHPAAGVPTGPGWGCDSNRVADWVAPDGTESQVPSCVPAADGTGPFTASPVQHVSTIFDALAARQLPWKIYGAATGKATGPSSGYGWSICPTFADCLYTQQRDNLVPTATVLDDAAAGNLPAYSVITPSSSSAAVIGTETSQHNHQSMLGGDNWIGRVVSAVENGPDWDSTAIFITYDDCGCFYDHVPPPTNADGTRQGVRLPMVIVSPYAAAGSTDSGDASIASVLAFTERTFGLPALSVNDAAAYDYRDAFGFDQPPRSGVALHQSVVPKASIAWAKAHPDDDDPT